MRVEISRAQLRNGRKSGSVWRYHCPNCDGCNWRSLCVFESDVFFCHYCGIKGTVDFLAKTPYENRPMKPDKVRQFATTTNEARIFYASTGSLLSKESKAGVDYLRRRGVEKHVAHAAGVTYHAERKALCFPVWGSDGELVAIERKPLDGGQPKSLGPKSQGVFMTHDSRRAEKIYVSEAAIDALSLAMLGQFAIATMGAPSSSDYYPDWLIDWLSSLKSVITAFDADTAGYKATRALASKLPNCERAKYPIGIKDANELLQACQTVQRGTVRNSMSLHAYGAKRPR